MHCFWFQDPGKELWRIDEQMTSGLSAKDSLGRNNTALETAPWMTPSLKTQAEVCYPTGSTQSLHLPHGAMWVLRSQLALLNPECVCSAIGQCVQCHNSKPWCDEKRNIVTHGPRPAWRKPHMNGPEETAPLPSFRICLPDFQQKGDPKRRDLKQKRKGELESNNSCADLNPLRMVS